MSKPKDLCLLETSPQGICTITLNRPDKHHALNGALCESLNKAFQAAYADDVVKVIMLRSQGTVFSAGLDLKEIATNPEALVAEIKSLIKLLQLRKKPIMVELAGDVYGGGLFLVGMADLVVAKSGCKLSMPEIKSKLWPFLLTPILMPVWPGNILNHSLHVVPLAVEQAYAQGWFAGVYDEATLSSEAQALARTLALKFCPAMITGLQQYWDMRLAHLTEAKLDQMAQCLIKAASDRLSD